jgi:hypothetical protein
MGNTNGVPKENKFYSSYCKQYDFVPESDIILEPIELNTNNFIFEIIHQQITNLGYSIKLKVPEYDIFKKNASIKEMIHSIQVHGFMSSDYTDVLSDLKIKGKCYFPKNLKIKGIPLLAGIILDNDIMKSINFPNIPKEVTDIICIVGYTPNNLLIKTTWSDKILNLDISFINNIKEVWEITVESPEPDEF